MVTGLGSPFGAHFPELLVELGNPALELSDFLRT